MISRTSRITMSSACFANAARAAASAISRPGTTASLRGVTACAVPSTREITPHVDRDVADPRWYPGHLDGADPEGIPRPGGGVDLVLAVRDHEGRPGVEARVVLGEHDPEPEGDERS